MYKKNIIFLVTLIFLLASCGTWDSVKRGLTGQKQKSTDEFMVKKKDPLILPPDFENLPSPDHRELAQEEISIFEKSLEEINTIEEVSSAGSTEDLILEKIKKQ
tara:strand:- start:153 stop:464 length:312 start_codon:yes stop_codon:yes gene_type:complete